MEKVLIVHTFHRFVAVGEGKPERKETFAKGITITVGENGVTADDAAQWIEKGLAQAARSEAAE